MTAPLTSGASAAAGIGKAKAFYLLAEPFIIIRIKNQNL
jgi:hypothetical protein